MRNKILIQKHKLLFKNHYSYIIKMLVTQKGYCNNLFIIIFNQYNNLINKFMVNKIINFKNIWLL